MPEASRNPVSSVDIDEAIAAARIRNRGRFTLKDVLKQLPGRKTEELELRVERSLFNDGDFFNDGEGNYICRSEFFGGAWFLITPDDLEIEAGILFPGHRFSPFIPADVFPSEVKLVTAAGDAVRQKNHSGLLSELFPYHLLMGSEQIFDFFIAEHAGNRRLSEAATGREKITLRVFDLAEFYAARRFSSGDALLCRIDDFRRGVFRFEYLPGDRRKSSEVKNFCDEFAAALEKVIVRFDTYFDIPEQLSWGFYYAPEKLRSRDGAAASLDEFIKTTRAIEIDYSSGSTVLARRKGIEAGGEPAVIPDGVSVSRGAIDSVEELLQSIGTPVTPVEIDAFIRECCYYREFDFDAFFQRCFGAEEPAFADDAQEAVFLNYIEDCWENITGNYNREEDEPKAEIRSALLEIVEERNAFLSEMRRQTGEKPPAAEKLRQLAEVSSYLDELLKLLASPDYQPGEEETEAMTETIAGLAETQEEIIGGIRGDFS